MKEEVFSQMALITLEVNISPCVHKYIWGCLPTKNMLSLKSLVSGLGTPHHLSPNNHLHSDVNFWLCMHLPSPTQSCFPPFLTCLNNDLCIHMLTLQCSGLTMHYLIPMQSIHKAVVKFPFHHRGGGKLTIGFQPLAKGTRICGPATNSPPPPVEIKFVLTSRTTVISAGNQTWQITMLFLMEITNMYIKGHFCCRTICPDFIQPWVSWRSVRCFNFNLTACACWFCCRPQLLVRAGSLRTRVCLLNWID